MPDNIRLDDIFAEVIMTKVHDIRENLSSANSARELLQQMSITNDPESNLWEILQRNLEAASFELTDFLLWFKCRQPGSVNVSSALQNIIARLRIPAESRQIGLVVKTSDEPVFALGHELALQRVLMTPISLAVYGTHVGSQVTISLETRGSVARFTVLSDDVKGCYSKIPDLPELRSGMLGVHAIVATLGGELHFKLISGASNSYETYLPLAERPSETPIA
jgi:signal transduction histidine kinase